MKITNFLVISHLVCVTVVCINYSVQSVCINVTPETQISMNHTVAPKPYVIFSLENDVLTFLATLSSAIAAIVVIFVLLIDNSQLINEDIIKTIKIIAPTCLAVLWAVITMVFIQRKSRDSHISLADHLLFR